MSNVEPRPQATPCHSDGDADGAPPPIRQLDTRDSELGTGLTIRRALPNRHKRLVGAWCFLDHFGPLRLDQAGPDQHSGMRVGPHPHIGLQTVTWLIEGEVLHRDSLGYRQLIRPGQLNIMTAGRGISHSEETPEDHSPALHGVQLWIALPSRDKDMAPAFDHHSQLPVIEQAGLRIALFVGEFMAERSPARVHTPLVGMELHAIAPGEHHLSLDSTFEYGLMLTEGAMDCEGDVLTPGSFYDLGRGRQALRFRNDAPMRAILIGGEPLNEEIILWWNFVARDNAELASAREDWIRGGDRFGQVQGYDGPALEAPPLEGRFKTG